MKTRTTPKKRRGPVKCDNTDIGATEFHVYYSCGEDGHWEHDESFATLAGAEAYCLESAEAYAENVRSGEDQPLPWEFYIYEVKAVRSFFYKYEVKLTVEQQRPA